MITINNEKQCCGCAACFDICPKHSIEMKEGTLGHLFPVVDSSTCINCKLCEKTCPMLKTPDRNSWLQAVYAARNNDFEIRKKSSSGGLFFTIASFLIKNGYIVFGAAFDDNLLLKTTYTDKSESLDPFCKSKYVQSSTMGVFKRIREFLNSGKKVMYCGTPCQISALKLFLNKDYRDLFLVDFFCHGVPSQLYFNQCKSLVEKKKNIRITGYEFRTKIKNGVTPHYFTRRFVKNGRSKSKIGFYYNSPCYAAFQSYVNLRESCYGCLYSGEKRFSDLTIGDFHNIEKYDKSINRFDGISTLIVNSSKGNDLLQNISGDLCLKQMDLQQLIYNGELFSGGTIRPKERDEFIADYKHLSFEELNIKWFSKKKYLLQAVYYHLPRIVRRMVKHIGGAK
ncbi:MAG: 2-oxoglutarate-acceptor oxidoreductase subunit OorD [Tenericutes bacterium ADurb.BinA124]|nr:MAG: 2-oxoglutarate-acceptor oxidoreductase subunit OorD [Tenericutes bacterium ADurb.BinA124]